MKVFYSPGSTFKPITSWSPVVVSAVSAAPAPAPPPPVGSLGEPEKVIPLGAIVVIGLLAWWLSRKKGE